MGARSKNFYNDIFSRSGYAAEAKLMQTARVTDTMLEGTVALPQGFEGVNVTALVAADDVDSHSGMPRQTAIEVEVRPV